MDELNKVISGFLECYHSVQENSLAEHLAEISKILLHTQMHSVKAVVEKCLMGLENEKCNTYAAIAIF